MTTPDAPVFEERPTEFVIRDAFVLGALPLALAGLAGVAGATGALGKGSGVGGV